MKTQRLLLTLLTISLFTLSFSGCSQKEPKVEIQYVDRYLKQTPYDFQLVDLNGAKLKIDGAYISSPTIRVGVNAYISRVPNYEIRLAPKDVAFVCMPYLEESKKVYRGVTDFYEFQITDYLTKEK